MAGAQPQPQPELTNQGRVFEVGPVAPRDADELVAQQLAHGGGGGGGGVVDERHDTKIKIAEALEAAARAAGGQPLEGSDAAAIRAAEARAVGLPSAAIPGGVAEHAQAAADANARAARGEDKVTIGDALTWNATAKLPTAKVVTREDAATVVEEEAAAAHGPGAAARPYGVGAALTEAARHNQKG